MNSKQRRTQRRAKPVKTEGRYEPTPMPTPEDMFSHVDSPLYRGYGWRQDFWGGFIIGGLVFMAVIVAWWMLVMGPMVRDLEHQQAYNELALIEAEGAVRDALLMCP